VPGYTGPITWQAINAWAERHGIVDPDEFRDFAAVIRATDDAYLKKLRERAADGRDD
jgi:hypothetical protein